jgi:hypothetical protein
MLLCPAALTVPKIIDENIHVVSISNDVHVSSGRTDWKPGGGESAKNKN